MWELKDDSYNTMGRFLSVLAAMKECSKRWDHPSFRFGNVWTNDGADMRDTLEVLVDDKEYDDGIAASILYIVNGDAHDFPN